MSFLAYWLIGLLAGWLLAISYWSDLSYTFQQLNISTEEAYWLAGLLASWLAGRLAIGYQLLVRSQLHHSIIEPFNRRSLLASWLAGRLAIGYQLLVRSQLHISTIEHFKRRSILACWLAGRLAIGYQLLVRSQLHISTIEPFNTKKLIGFLPLWLFSLLAGWLLAISYWSDLSYTIQQLNHSTGEAYWLVGWFGWSARSSTVFASHQKTKKPPTLNTSLKPTNFPFH